MKVIKFVFLVAALVVLIVFVMLARIKSEQKIKTISTEDYTSLLESENYTESKSDYLPSAYSTQTETKESSTTEPEKNNSITTGKQNDNGQPLGFKEFWDEYEDFVDSYVKVMNNPENPEYKEKTEQYKKYSETAEKYENDSSLTDEELEYMTGAQARISAKIAEASLS